MKKKEELEEVEEVEEEEKEKKGKHDGFSFVSFFGLIRFFFPSCAELCARCDVVCDG